jgi:hypothetical protein
MREFPWYQKLREVLGRQHHGDVLAVGRRGATQIVVLHESGRNTDCRKRPVARGFGEEAAMISKHLWG